MLAARVNVKRETWNLEQKIKMKTVTIFKALGPVDAKNIQRDSLLGWMAFLPFILALLLRIAIPWLTELLTVEMGFDLRPYYPLLMSFYFIMAPAISGVVIGFLLLDERDSQILKLLLVTPMPLNGYLFYRLSVPLLLATVTTMLGYPLMQVMALSFVELLVAAFLASFLAPFMALVLATFADNKVAGFAVMKMVNGLSVLPIGAYFFPEPWQWLAGIMPMYWPMKVVWLMGEGQGFWEAAVIGVVANVAAVWWLLGLFRRVVRR